MKDDNVLQWLQQAREAGLSDMEIQQQLKAVGLDDTRINQLLVKGYTRPAEKTKTPQTEELIIRTGTLPSVITLIKEAWNIYKSRFGKFFLFSIIILTLGLVVGFIYFVIGDVVTDLNFSTYFKLEEKFTADLVELSILFLFLSGFWIAAAFIFSWLLAAFIITIHNQEMSLGTILNHSFRLLIPCWWITLLISFFIGGAINLLIIPGIILAVWFSMTTFILVAENVRGLPALLKSKEYVSGYWWAVFSRQLAISALISAPLVAIFYIFKFAQAEDFGGWFIIIIISLLIPFGLCYCYVIYRHLRYIKGEKIPVIQNKNILLITAIVGWAVLPLIIISLTGRMF